jgi:hypothetical protein
MIHSDPLVLWELSIPRYYLSVAIHACDWALVIILWRDNYFRLCCIIHATGYDHVRMLWVVPYVPEGIGWIGNYFYITCVDIRSSFYLLCCYMMVMCEHWLHTTSPLWAHRATPRCNGMGRTSRDSYLNLIHEATLGGFISGTLEFVAMVGLYVLIILVLLICMVMRSIIRGIVHLYGCT